MRCNPAESDILDSNEESSLIRDPPFFLPEFEEAFRYIVNSYDPPEREIAIFLPCALKKPYSESPSHRLFHRVIDSTLSSDLYHIVIFGTCGVVPGELESMYPLHTTVICSGMQRSEDSRCFLRDRDTSPRPVPEEDREDIREESRILYRPVPGSDVQGIPEIGDRSRSRPSVCRCYRKKS